MGARQLERNVKGLQISPLGCLLGALAVWPSIRGVGGMTACLCGMYFDLE